VFRTEVLPKLVGVSTSKIALGTGLSRNFAATIKSGKHVPHPRHWAALRQLSRESIAPWWAPAGFS
jgi:hypothetical protein